MKNFLTTLKENILPVIAFFSWLTITVRFPFATEGFQTSYCLATCFWIIGFGLYLGFKGEKKQDVEFATKKQADSIFHELNARIKERDQEIADLQSKVNALSLKAGFKL